MATLERFYRRLPGRGITLTHLYTLYESSDCLLQVESTGWSEKYKRFYYADIAAIMLRRTHSGAIATAILCLLTVPWLALAAAGVQPVFMAFLSVAFGAPLLHNMLAGPTCACHIYTAVKAERLPSLGRARAARRVLDRIRPLIQHAQGGSAPELQTLPPGPQPASGAAEDPPRHEPPPSALL